MTKRDNWESMINKSMVLGGFTLIAIQSHAHWKLIIPLIFVDVSADPRSRKTSSESEPLLTTTTTTTPETMTTTTPETLTKTSTPTVATTTPTGTTSSSASDDDAVSDDVSPSPSMESEGTSPTSKPPSINEVTGAA